MSIPLTHRLPPPSLEMNSTYTGSSLSAVIAGSVKHIGGGNLSFN